MMNKPNKNASAPGADADPIASAVSSQRKARLTPNEITLMLATVARVQSVFLNARFKLTTHLFDPSEARYVLVTRAIFAAADDNKGMLPTDPKAANVLVELKAGVEVAADVMRAFYTPSVERQVLGDGGLLDTIFSIPLTPEIEDTGMTLLSRFLTERKLSDPLRRAIAGLASQDTIDDPAALIAEIEAHARDISGIGVDPGADAIVDDVDWRPEGARIVSTKLPWLDDLMGGGHAKGEVNLILGITSGGKSALATQLAFEGAELQACIAAEHGPTEAGIWYYMSWELCADELRERFYSYGAKIHHHTYHSHPKRPLTTSEDPAGMHDYERDHYVNSPGNPLMGERERTIALNKRLSGPNNRLRVVDYSGKIPGQGLGGVAEVAGYLRREAARGRKIAGVVMDYAGLAVGRYIGAQKLRPDSAYALLAGFNDQVRNQIAIPFECPCWVLHQFHAEVRAKPPGAKTHYNDALGCKNIGDNTDFTFGLSPYSASSGLLGVTMSKHRRVQGRDDPVIVRFDGRFGAFLSPDMEYVVDPQTRQIVPRDYMETLPVRPVRGAPAPVNPMEGM